MVSWLSDSLLTIGLSRTHGEQIGEKMAILDLQWEIHAVSPQWPHIQLPDKEDQDSSPRMTNIDHLLYLHNYKFFFYWAFSIYINFKLYYFYLHYYFQ